MKRTISALLALIVLISMQSVFAEAAAGSAYDEPARSADYTEAKPGDYIGTWYAHFIYSKGMTYFPTAEYRIEINRDSTAKFCVDGEEYELTWAYSTDGVTISNFNIDIASMFIEDGSLIINHLFDPSDIPPQTSFYNGGGCTFEFKREPADYLLLPQAISAQSEDEFFGTYLIKYLKEGCKASDVSDVSEYGLLCTIEPYSISLQSGIFLTDFKDGKLTVYANYDGYTDTVSLTDEDGTIIIEELYNGNLSVILYLVRAEESETAEE